MCPELETAQPAATLLAMFVAGCILGFLTALRLMSVAEDNASAEIEKLNRDRIALKLVAEYWKAQAEKDVQPIIIGGARDNADVQDGH